MTAVEHRAKAVFDGARKAESRESSAAYAADALVALVSGAQGSTRIKGPRPTVHIRVDLNALKRGHLKPGEVCEIPGVGPVSVASATKALSDAFVKVLVTDASDVYSVCHIGRSVPAHVQSALEERDRVCVVPGCQTRRGLENHHWDVPYVRCGTSTLAGLARVCAWHHDLLTYEGYELSGGPGKWSMRAPPGGPLFDTG